MRGRGLGLKIMVVSVSCFRIANDEVQPVWENGSKCQSHYIPKGTDHRDAVSFVAVASITISDQA
jgi:hypothetical protein